MRTAIGFIAAGLAAASLAACGGGSTSPGGTTGGGGGGGGGPKRVFVTSATYPGNFGGLSAADANCKSVADAATAAGLGSFAGSTWKAWLSSSTVNAIDRLADVGPWYRVDGTTKVFNNKAQVALVPAQLAAAIGTDERGNQLPAWVAYSTTTATAWTGTGPGGLHSSDTCQDWQAGFCQWDYGWTATYSFGNYVIRPTATNGLGYKITSGTTTGCVEPTWPTTPGAAVSEPDGCTRWTASTSISTYTYIAPTTPNGHLYRATTSGTTGPTEPAWPTSRGTNVVDGGVTWQEVGLLYSYVVVVLANGTVGDATAMDDTWTTCGYWGYCGGPTRCCQTPQRLICFEQ